VLQKCGFSNLVVQVLREEGVEEFKGIDVLADPEVREGIKQYTKWPTIPQLFINKEFIGGADIVKQLFQTRELTEILTNAGVKLNPPPEEEHDCSAPGHSHSHH